MTRTKKKANSDATYIPLDYRTVVVVYDECLIATLVTSGVPCRLLTKTSKGATAVFDDGPVLQRAMERFLAGGLKVDARGLWESLDELNWKLADEALFKAYGS